MANGAILACACYSIGHAAITSADRAGAIRIMAVLPSFVGLYVGKRLLQRVEAAIGRDCDRAFCCVPELRVSMVDWAERRGFTKNSLAHFPREMAETFSRQTRLVVMVKQLNIEVPLQSQCTTQSENPEGFLSGCALSESSSLVSDVDAVD